MAHQDDDSWINCICGSLCVGKSHDMNVGKIWTHWESNSRPPECITWCAPLLHHMPLQSTFMFPGLPIIRIYPLSTDIIHVTYHLTPVDELTEDIVHHCLECCRGVTVRSASM